jgi:hypothetical protein
VLEADSIILLHHILNEILKSLQITNFAWQAGKEDSFQSGLAQLFFSCMIALACLA